MDSNIKDSVNETELVENVVEDTVVEAEEPHFTLTINVSQLPGKTQVL
ncbi:7537_t:CDS:1, partial [Funneliformis geosporum]